VNQRFSADTRAVVLTVNDRCSRGEQTDESGPAIARRLKAAGADAVQMRVLPAEMDAIITALRHYARDARMIVTIGGAGLAERDVTPDATRLVCERLVDGLAERMRVEGLKHTPFAPLSRAVCGISGTTLIVNLPGNPENPGSPGTPGGPAEAEGSLAAILPLLPQALDLLAGKTEPPVKTAKDRAKDKAKDKRLKGR
jgi:molybdenum cofactor synthesis domain-containing protein